MERPPSPGRVRKFLVNSVVRVIFPHDPLSRVVGRWAGKISVSGPSGRTRANQQTARRTPPLAEPRATRYAARSLEVARLPRRQSRGPIEAPHRAGEPYREPPRLPRRHRRGLIEASIPAGTTPEPLGLPRRYRRGLIEADLAIEHLIGPGGLPRRYRRGLIECSPSRRPRRVSSASGRRGWAGTRPGVTNLTSRGFDGAMGQFRLARLRVAEEPGPGGRCREDEPSARPKRRAIHA